LTNKQSRTWQRQSPEQGGGERLAPLITGPHPLRFATGLQQRAIRAVLKYRYGHSSGQTAITEARSEHPYWLGGRKGIRHVKNLGVVGLGSPLVSVGVIMLAMMGHMVVLGTALGTLMVPGYWSLRMG